MSAAFADLREKYEEMLALRRDEAEAPAKARLAALASRFPGALREIDDLPESEIAARIAALARAELDPDRALPWMHAMTRFHALARGALFAKRSLEAEPREWPTEAEPFRAELARVAKPPRGRLMDLVYEKLATELGTTPNAAKTLVFGLARRAR